MRCAVTLAAHRRRNISYSITCIIEQAAPRVRATARRMQRGQMPQGIRVENLKPCRWRRSLPLAPHAGKTRKGRTRHEETAHRFRGIGGRGFDCPTKPGFRAAPSSYAERG